MKAGWYIHKTRWTELRRMGTQCQVHCDSRIKKLLGILVFFLSACIFVYLANWISQDYTPAFVGSKTWIFYNVIDNRKTRNSPADIEWGTADAHSRLLCIVLTVTLSHDTRARAVSRTWGRRCDQVVFSTNSDQRAQFNTIYVGQNSLDKRTITHRVFKTLRYVYFKLSRRFDWFLIADDDTYVIVENLRHFLLHKNVSIPGYYGFNYGPTDLTYKNVSLTFAHGGSGFVLNRLTLKALATQGYISSKRGLCHPLEMKQKHSEHADVNVGMCLLKLGIYPSETADEHRREIFLKENPIHLLNNQQSERETEQTLFGYRDVVRHKDTIYEALSDKTVSFHYMTPGDMYFVDFLLYNMRRGHKAPQDKFMLSIDGNSTGHN